MPNIHEDQIPRDQQQPGFEDDKQAEPVVSPVKFLPDQKDDKPVGQFLACPLPERWLQALGMVAAMLADDAGTK